MRKARKKQHTVELKEIKMGPSTEEHDYNFKMRNAMKFLKNHNKVKFTIRFRGRQHAHKDLGFDVLDKIKEDLIDYVEVDQPPTNQGRTLSMVVSPKNDLEEILKNEKKEKNNN